MLVAVDHVHPPKRVVSPPQGRVQLDLGGVWQEAPAVPGRSYRFSAWCWADDGNPYGPWDADEQVMKIEFLSGATQGVTLVRAATNSLSGVGRVWENRGLTATAPANADWVRVVLLARNVSDDGALQFDDLVLEWLPELAAPVIQYVNPTGTTSCTVRWSAVPGATGYVLDAATHSLFQPASRASDLFIWIVHPVDTFNFLGGHDMDRAPGDFVAGYEARAAAGAA